MYTGAECVEADVHQIWGSYKCIGAVNKQAVVAGDSKSVVGDAVTINVVVVDGKEVVVTGAVVPILLSPPPFDQTISKLK